MPERWEEFQVLYREELTENESAVETLEELLAGKRVTFIFGAKDEQRNGAVVLREFLMERNRT